MQKSGGFEKLKKEIIDKNFCTFCGSCASFCSHITLRDKPELETDCAVTKENVLKCSDNGTCYDVCPMTQSDLTELE